MRGAVKMVLATSALLFMLSSATCQYGQQYAWENRSAEERAAMQFTHYGEEVGEGWQQLGGFILLFAVSLSIAGVSLWAAEQRGDFCDNHITTLRLTGACEPNPVAAAAPRPAIAPPATLAAVSPPPLPRFTHFDEHGHTPLERALADF